MSINDVLVVIVLIGVLLIPGALVALGAGLPRWTALAAAPVVTYGLTALSLELCTLFGLPFSWIAVAVVTVLVTGFVLAARRLLGGGAAAATPAQHDSTIGAPARTRLAELLMIAGVLVGTLLGAIVALTGMGRLDAINQDWDASFHANATRFILETNNPDPTALSALYPLDGFYYPNAWHGLTAIVGELSGGEVTALLGAQTLLVAGLAGLGLAALVRAHSGRVAAAATVPVLLASFTGFPTDVLWRGPLLPFGTAIALIPAFLLVFDDTLRMRRPPPVVVTALAAAGLLAIQPAAALTAAVFAAFLVGARWFSHPQRVRPELAVAVVSALATVVIAIEYVRGAFFARSAAAVAPIDWPAVESPGQAVGDLLLLNHAARYPQYWLILLLVGGLVGFAALRRLWWFLGGTSVFALFFVATAAYDIPLTESLSLPWWNDRYRFVAIVTLGLAIVAAQGVVTFADVLVRLARRMPAVRGWPRRPAFGAAVLVVLGVVGLGSSGFYGPYNSGRMSMAYGETYVSAAEVAAMDYLAGVVPPGSMVMNDPKDGSVWMYALDGIEPVFGHVVDPGSATTDLREDVQVLLASFRCLDSDPRVRDIIERDQITHLFLGPGFLRPWFERAGGLRDLSRADSLELIYSDGGVRIFEVDLVAVESAELGPPGCGSVAAS